MPLEECCSTCLGCGSVYCRDEPQPGEASGLCESCWLTEDPEAVA